MDAEFQLEFCFFRQFRSYFFGQFCGWGAKAYESGILGIFEHMFNEC